MSKSTKFLMIILFILVLVSLSLNLYLIWQLQRLEQQAKNAARAWGPVVQETLAQTITDLQTFQEATIEFNVAVNEDFPVEADIPFNETIEIPVQLSVPIKQEINTTILLDPLGTGQGFPVDVTVPVDIEIPIDTSIPVSIDRTIPISTTVPLNLDVPIALNLGDTELAGYIGRLQESLTSLEGIVEQALLEVTK